MTGHEQVSKQLAVYRALSRAEQRAVEQHLRGCPACAERLAAYQAMDDGLARLRQQDRAELIPPAGQKGWWSPPAALEANRPPNSAGRRSERRPLGGNLMGQLAGLVLLLWLVIYLITLFGGARRNGLPIATGPATVERPPTLRSVAETADRPAQTELTPTPMRSPSAVDRPTDTPARPAVLTQTPVITFDYGMHVAPVDDLSAQIKQLQELQIGWVFIEMPWREVEPRENDYQWAAWDERIAAYHQAGLQILLSITAAPDWARPADDDKAVNGLPEEPQDYAKFVAQVARRYGDQIGAIEVWQAQNFYYAVGGEGRIVVDTYMALLKAAYQAIKTVDPTIVVISGSLTPTQAVPPFGIDDLAYLRRMYALGLKDVSDAIGAHLSGFANPPEATLSIGRADSPEREFDDHRSFFFRDTLEAYREVMLAYDDGHTLIWATSFGWPVLRYYDKRFDFAKENSLEDQAAYTVRAFELGRQWGWVGPMFLFNLDYARLEPGDALANYSLLTEAGPTLTYLQLLAHLSPPTGVAANDLSSCPVTRPPDPPFVPPAPYPSQPPGGRGHPLGETAFWHGSPELWTAVPVDGMWPDLPYHRSVYSQKIFWWREGYAILDEPAPELVVTGRRLDTSVPLLLASRATNAGGADIGEAMLVGVDFPTLGCWEITGYYQGRELRFVVWLGP